MASAPSINWKGVSAVVGLLVTLGGVAIGFTSSHAVIGRDVIAQERRLEALESHSTTNGKTIAVLTEQVTTISKNVEKVQEKQDEQSTLLNRILGKLDQLNGEMP